MSCVYNVHLMELISNSLCTCVRVMIVITRSLWRLELKICRKDIYVVYVVVIVVAVL